MYLRPLRSSLVLQHGINRAEQAATPALRSHANIQAATKDDFGIFVTQRATCKCVKGILQSFTLYKLRHTLQRLESVPPPATQTTNL